MRVHTAREGLWLGKVGEVAQEPQLAGAEGVLQLSQEQTNRESCELRRGGLRQAIIWRLSCTHRVAIANSPLTRSPMARFASLGRTTRADGKTKVMMTLAANEFIRAFCCTCSRTASVE